MCHQVTNTTTAEIQKAAAGSDAVSTLEENAAVTLGTPPGAVVAGLNSLFHTPHTAISLANSLSAKDSE